MSLVYTIGVIYEPFQGILVLKFCLLSSIFLFHSQIHAILICFLNVVEAFLVFLCLQPMFPKYYLDCPMF